MKTVLLISSFVSSSQVGANASAFCLRRLGCDVIVLPTTLFGRHPGWGAPGGKAVETEVLRAMWDAVAAQNIKFDAVMSGYMAAREHIDLTVDIINSVRADNPQTLILIDPVKGDDGRLYIPQHRADAMQDRLVPKADILTPNLYELEYLAGRTLNSLDDIISAARRIGMDMLVTSVPHTDQIGALWVGQSQALYIGHESFKRVPNGGGDSLAATFLAHYLNGESIETAQQKSVSSIFHILSAATSGGHRELPLTACQDMLITPPSLLDIQDISS